MKNLCWLMLFFGFLNTAHAQWEFIGGQARDIGVGADGTTWVIGWPPAGNDHPIAKWNGNFWETIPGEALRIDVGPNGRAWVVDRAGSVYRYNGNGWDNLGGHAYDVGVGADGTVWRIGWTPRPGGYNIARWNGNIWEEIPGGGVRIDVDPNGRAWIVNDAGNIFRYNGSGWDGLPGQGRDISIGADGTPWLIGWTATPGGNLIYRWNGSSWLNVPGGATNISAGRGVVWGVNDAGLIFRQNTSALTDQATENWDFESGNLITWIKEGNAFNNQPTYGNIGFNRSGIPWGSNVSLGGDYWRNLVPQNEWNNGRQGNYWIGTSDNHSTPQTAYTNLQGDAPTGKLFSKEFTTNTKYIHFLLGGKSTDGKCKVEFLCLDDGTIAKMTRVIVGWKERIVGNKPIKLPVYDTKNFPTRVIEGKTYIVISSIVSSRIALGTIPALDNNFFMRSYFQVADSLRNKPSRIAIIDDDTNGHINVDDFRFGNDVPPNPVDNTQAPLWGMVDMHTHPMSEAAFGGDIFAGKIDGTPQAALFKCSEREHGGFDVFKPTDDARRMMVNQMEEDSGYKAYGREAAWPCDHWFGFEGGTRNFCFWPSFREVTHQEMFKDWLKRAKDGGLRVIVALAHHNQVLCEIGHGSQAERSSCDDDSSLRAQIGLMRAFASRNTDWMAIAETPNQLRSIVRAGKLAVVIGSEMDNFGNFYRPMNSNNQPNEIYNPNPTVQQVKDRIIELKRMGINYIFPVHLVDNIVGGTALYSEGFEKAQRFYNNGRGFEIAEGTIADSIGFRRTLNVQGQGGLAGGGGIEGIIEGIGQAIGSGVQDIILSTRGVDPSVNDNTPLESRRATYGLKNNKGLNPNNNIGNKTIREMMRQGMMLDIDHMSQKTADEVINIAKNYNYPLNSGHTGFRGMGISNENTRTGSQIDYIRRSGGMQGIGWGCGDSRDVNEVLPNRIYSTSRIQNNAPGTAKSFAQSYFYALEKYQGRQVAFGTDINSIVVDPGPRFGDLACWCISAERKSFESQFKSAQSNPVRYNGGVDSNGSFFWGSTGDNRPMNMCETLGKKWSLNIDGVAHYGLLPDFVQDLKNVGMNSSDLSPLFMGAEYFAQMWEKCERQKTNVR